MALFCATEQIAVVKAITAGKKHFKNMIKIKKKIVTGYEGHVDIFNLFRR
jgi:hypothetical protein